MNKRKVLHKINQLKRMKNRLNMRIIGSLGLALGGVIIIMSLLISILSSQSMLDKKLNAGRVDKVQIVLAMGNPKYGSESKIIEDEEEIKNIIDIFNGAKVGKKVKSEDEHVAMASRYIFYNDDKVVEEIYFNANDSERVYYKEDLYYAKYKEITPYEFYEQSKAKVINVDIDLEEIK